MIVPWKIYGNDIKTLEITRKNAIFDLNPFFRQGFAIRDVLFGSPDFPRIEGKNAAVRYNFTLDDLAESFLSRYHPGEFANFLNQHLDMSSDQSEALVQRVLDFEKDRKIIGVCSVPKGNDSHGPGLFRLNCSVEDYVSALDSLPKQVFTKTSKTRREIFWARRKNPKVTRGCPLVESEALGHHYSKILDKYIYVLPVDFKTIRKVLGERGILLYHGITFGPTALSVQRFIQEYGADVSQQYFEKMRKKGKNTDQFSDLLKALADKGLLAGHL